MLKSTARAIYAYALSAALVFAAPPAGKKIPADLSTFIVVGDSLSAGVQNFSLLDTQQVNGFASLIANQAHTNLTLPLVPLPGAPNVLELVSPGPPPVIKQADGTLPSVPRDNPEDQVRNISVPGITVGEALVPPSQYSNAAVALWGDIVLGFPGLLTGKAPGSQLTAALALKPTTVLEWLGNNDALVPALVGQLNTLTPLVQFTVSYEKVLDTLSSTGATIVTANIPDVTEVPYFTSVKSIAASVCGTPAKHGCTTAGVAQTLGVGPGDYIRLSGLALADGILSGTVPGPLPTYCPSPLAALTTSQIPCVLTAADAGKVRTAIAAYNTVIFAESALHGALMVDIHALVDQISAHGYKAGGKTLTTAFLGGLFSLDGIHPSNTGYAVIANAFIDSMDKSLKLNMADVNVADIAAKDPLVF